MDNTSWKGFSDDKLEHNNELEGDLMESVEAQIQADIESTMAQDDSDTAEKEVEADTEAEGDVVKEASRPTTPP